MPPEETLESIASDVAAEKAKDAEPVVDSQTADNPPKTTDNPTDAENKAFIERLKTATGIDLSGKYDNDDAALKGLSEAYKLVGQRNEDADRWKQFTEIAAGKEEEIQEVLRGTKKASSPPEPVRQENDENWTPKTYEEIRLLAKSIFDENGAIRADADKRLVNRYTSASQRLQETAFELAFSPEKVREKLLGSVKDEILKEATKASEERLESQRIAAEMKAISDKHADKLYVNGQRDAEHLSEFGRQVKSEFDELIDTGSSAGPKTLQKAIKIVTDRQPRPNPTRPSNPNSGHKATVAPTDDKGPSLEDRFRKGLTLADLLMESAGKT